MGLAGSGGDGSTSHVTNSLLEEERGAYVKVWDGAAWYVTVREGRQRRNQVGFTSSRDQKRE